MNLPQYKTALSGVVAIILVISLFAPVVYADSHQDDEPVEDDQPAGDDRPSYRVVQGDQEISVDPIEGDIPVDEFYDYRYSYLPRDDPAWGRSFSSRGTTEYQADSTSILMLYEGPSGVSLVAVHDKYHEDREDGTAGGSASWEITGLPDDGEWAVVDDDYGWRNETVTQDDIHQLDADHRNGAAGNDGEPPEGVDARLSWVWTNGRTDGMAYRGLDDDDVSITIDPSFNEDSYHRYGDQRRADEDPDDPQEQQGYNGTIEDWQVIVPTDDGDDFERVSLSTLEEPVRIEPQPQYDEPVAGLSGPEQATVDQAVGFTTSGTTGEIERYEWTVDGTPIESSDGPTLSHTFTETGTAEVAVTVSTPDNQTDTESRAIEIVEREEGEDQEEDQDGASGEQIPGFGPVAGVVALLAVTLFAARRRNT